MRLLSHLKRVKAVHRKLFPPPKPEIWMPVGVHLYQDENDVYYYLPGQKEIWERSMRAGIEPNVYVNILPDEVGCCSCDEHHDETRCPCSQKLWDAIDLTSLERVPDDESEVA